MERRRENTMAGGTVTKSERIKERRESKGPKKRNKYGAVSGCKGLTYREKEERH